MPSTRTKFVDLMTVFPQRCIISGTPNSKGQEQALDLGFQIPDYGQVYVSARGMAWLARQFGYISPKESEEQLEAVHKELKKAQAQVKELRKAIAHVPETIEGVIHGIQQLSDDAIANLAGAGGLSRDESSAVDSEERAEADANVDGAA